MCYVRKTKLLMELWYNKLHALIHISNKEAEYQYPGQRTSMSEKFRRRFLRDRDNGNGPWRIKNFPSVESEGHNTLEERTVSTDRHAKETSVRQKRAEVFRKLQVSSQEIRLNKKSEPNWEVFFFFFPPQIEKSSIPCWEAWTFSLLSGFKQRHGMLQFAFQIDKVGDSVENGCERKD